MSRLTAPRRFRRAWRGGAVLALSGALLTSGALAGCASESSKWQPPQWPESGGVTLVKAEVEQPEQVGVDAGLEKLEFIEGRIRNDGLPMQARYVQIPGAPAFNDLVTGVIGDAIANTGADYAPQAFPVGSGLGDRGCVPGSLSWDAAKVLSNPATGPVGGSGTAITCEPIAAFGSVVGVEMRTVTGSGKGVESDYTTIVYADLESGEAFTGAEMWNDGVPEKLWLGAVDTLRRDAGGLSGIATEAPSKKQRALAESALQTPVLHENGSATVILPAGIEAVELADIGIERTEEPMAVEIDAATVEAWENKRAKALLKQRDKKFVGMPAWNANNPVDCSIVPCVAVTYDDGPSDLTPKLLDTLRSERTPATFYMLGNSATLYPDIVKRASDEGHELASHTMSHPELTTLSPAAARAQVHDAGKILSDLSGQKVASYRPPYGALNDKVFAEIGWPAILWSIDTNDWRKPGREALVQRSSGAASPGDIILFHDIHADSVEVAGTVMQQLKDRGLTPVTVEQLFGGNIPNERVTRR
ncbi:MAG: polysaccharide deacetylase family protein [Leucobacter sp.]